MRRWTAVLVVLAALIPASAHAYWFVDAQTGIAAAGYNDVRIPGDSGDTISLTDDLRSDPAAYMRLRVGNTFLKRHTISFLYAPLTLVSHGRLDSRVLYDGVVFPEDSRVRAVYRFDSYRLTYRYDFIRSDKLEAGAGLTVKIRDASVALYGAEQAQFANTGVVPLVRFRLLWSFAPPVSLLLEGDALAGPQGRAEDAMLGLQLDFNEHVTGLLGYRILEGGADNDEVYTFSLIHFGVIGITARF